MSKKIRDPKIVLALDQFRAKRVRQLSKSKGIGKKTRNRLAGSHWLFKFSAWLDRLRVKLDRMARRHRDHNLGKLAQTYKLEFPEVEAIFVAALEDWKATRVKCKELSIARSSNDAFVEALACQLPYQLDEVKKIFIACKGDRGRTRRVATICARAGVISTADQLKRLTN